MATKRGTEHGRRLAELRRSGAAGKHGDRRTRRNRDRGAQRRYAITESQGTGPR